MKTDVVYYYKKDRKQQSKIFINMGVACIAYIAGLYGYEDFFNKTVAEDFKFYYILIFTISSVILFYIAWWHRVHPGTYEALITKDRFIVRYPESEMWSFEVKVSDIERFEHRNTLSHAGKGIAKSGVLLKDGSFHEVCMNYGGNINKMYSAVKTIKNEVTGFS
ncbi:hypothetical protein [Colwellia sp. RSH04]|uniref:hypothetical protein n=1 Tax=Colwellia sp. RSH04 TaxID=2305464 RepID=UPI000E58C172|nr:hypothetical protein [Colwellia sp. RSH04]RHW75513.1 hypothetical protein D1094_12385 [Colwellia sp. RSH04]